MTTEIDDYVERVLATAPTLTAEQRTKLGELLRPVRVEAALTTTRVA